MFTMEKTARQAFDLDTLRSVLEGWAAAHELVCYDFHAGFELDAPGGFVSVSFRPANSSLH